MATDQQSQLQQLLLDGIEKQNLNASESRHTRRLIDETSKAIATALRNELTVVSGNVELIGMMQVSDAVQRFADTAQLAANSANRVLERISLLDCVGKGEYSVFDVYSELASIRTTLAQLLRSDTQINWTAEPGNLSLKGDPEEFRIIILELLKNALDAMPSGGTLNVTCKEHRLRSDPAQQLEWWVVIEVSDSGYGMSESQCATALAPVARINEKPQLALGLCLLDRYVTNRQGVLGIRSSECQGTTVTVFLPLSAPLHVSVSG